MNSVKTLLVCLLCIASITIKVCAAFPSDHIVVLVSLDGLAAFYFDDPKAEMPNLRALARQGAHASSMVSVIPTVTWPNHTTLVTGVTPARHGVLGNNYFDRDTRTLVTLIQDPLLDKEQIVKVPTIYDLAKAAGLRTAGIHWPATRNAKNLDWQVPATRSMENTERYTTPSLLKECAENGLAIVDHNVKERQPNEMSDALSVAVFNFVVKKHRPQFAMLHIGNVDHTQHEHGPRSAAAYAAIRAQDEQLGQVWKELQTDYPGKATLFVVSDHGFSPINHIVSPRAILGKVGVPVTGPIEIVTQGGSLMIYILDKANRATLQRKIVKAFANEKGVRRILTGSQLKANGVPSPETDSHAADIIVLGDKGYAFGNTSSGQIPTKEKPETRGSHGQDPLLWDLKATFVAWGVGIQSGVKIGEIKNVDVAPTIAEVLQLKLPNVGGQPLKKILAD